MKRVRLDYLVAFAEVGANGIHVEINLEMTYNEMIAYVSEFERKNKCECNYHFGYLDKF